MFARHYAGAAPCAPARACLYTGLCQMTNRVCRNGTPLDARHGNIASYARRLGYDPTLFGYTDTAPDPRMRAARDPSLTSYEGVLPGFTRGNSCLNIRSSGSLACRGVVSAVSRYPSATAHAGASATRRHSPATTRRPPSRRRFIRWLSPGRERAWFARISFISPHPPFVVPPPTIPCTVPDDGPLPVGGLAERKIHPFVDCELSISASATSWSAPGRRRSQQAGSGSSARLFRHDPRSTRSSDVCGPVKTTTVDVRSSSHIRPCEMTGDHQCSARGGFFD